MNKTIFCHHLTESTPIAITPTAQSHEGGPDRQVEGEDVRIKADEVVSQNRPAGGVGTGHVAARTTQQHQLAPQALDRSWTAIRTALVKMLTTRNRSKQSTAAQSEGRRLSCHRVGIAAAAVQQLPAQRPLRLTRAAQLPRAASRQTRVVAA